MGVYSQYSNTVSGMGNTVVADESYVGAIGAYQMIEESEINSYNIFESVIGRDFAEAGNNIGAITESDMEAINEASASGVWQNVVSFVQKIWGKIKGILNSIKTKIQGTLTKDGKALYKKYEKTINSKLNNGQLSDFKFKWKSPKHEISNAFGDAIKGFLSDSNCTLYEEINANIKKAEKFKEFHDKGSSTQKGRNYKNVNYSNNSDDIAKVNDTEDYGNDNTKVNSELRPYTSDECTDMLETALGEICKTFSNDVGDTVTAKEFPKEFHDAIFEDEEEKDKFSDVQDSIAGILQGGKKILDGIDSAQKQSDRTFKEIRTRASNVQKSMQKANESKTTQSTYAAAANRLAGRTTTCLNIISRVSGMAFSAATAVTKEHIKQCRAVWIKAAAYNQKKAPYEEATLLEAMADVSDYEVEEMFA